MTKEETAIYNIIRGRKGRLSAVTSKKLSLMTGFERRHVRRIIKILIEQHGLPIAASVGSPAGYYFPSSPSEITNYSTFLLHHILSTSLRLKVFKHSCAIKIERAVQEELPFIFRDVQKN